MGRAFVLAVALTLQLAPVAGQVRVHRLARPAGTAAEPFTLIRGARELPDGRLLVTDWIEQRVALVDFRTGSVTDRGRTGSGPQEFRLPGSLLAFRADSTLLVDAGNQRVAVLDGTGTIRRFLNPPHTAARSPGGADARGRVYYSIPPWLTEQPVGGDSVQLAVWDPGTDAVRIIATVHGWTPSRQKPGAGPRIPYVVFAPQDTWTVNRTGRVAIVRGDGYAVEWIDERGSRRGPRQQQRPVPAGASDRREAVRQFAANAAQGGRNADGGAGLVAAPAESRNARALAELENASTFAATLPAFRAGSALTDAAGRLWVARWERTGAAVRYDVFDADGNLTTAIELEAGRRIVALGVSHLYAVRTDRDDLQWLERYPLPAQPQGNRDT